MSGNILCIHEIEDWMLDLDLSEYKEITFDDGMYSQYLHLDHFLKFGVPLTFFISTEIVQDEHHSQNSKEFLSCSEAHKNFFKSNDKSQYMNWSQIQEISTTTNCTIGGHSHSHNIKRENIKELHTILVSDTNTMLDEFFTRGINIDKFCYPYNEELPMYKTILNRKGLHKLYKSDRKNIEELKWSQ